MNNLELVEKFMELAQEVENITIKHLDNDDAKGYADDEYLESLIDELMKSKKEILKRMGGNK